MASLRKHPKSGFRSACFTLPDGRRTQRSTKETDRRKAQKIADAYEDATRRARTETQARKVVADIYELINGQPRRQAGAILGMGIGSAANSASM